MATEVPRNPTENIVFGRANQKINPRIMKCKTNVAKKISIFGPPFLNIAFHLPPSIRKTLHLISLQFQSFALKESDSFSQKDWQEVQSEKFKKIIEVAKVVPYWKKVFFIFDSPEREFKELNLQDFPVFSRKELKGFSLQIFTSSNISQKRFIQTSTSGSTGEPFILYQDERELVIRQANIIQEFNYNGFKVKKPILILGLGAHTHLTIWGTRFTGFTLENEIERRRKLYPFLSVAKPEFLISTPSLVKRFIYFLKKDNQNCVLKAVKCTGETLDEATRKEIKDFFQCQVFSVYATRETSVLGIECAEKKFHLAPWLNFIEILDDNDKNLPDGEDGRVVVTYFENFVMPFIRYDIGDRGMINSEPCSCGRQTKTITFTGRTGGSIETPSGKSVMFLAISSAMARDFHDEIARYQFEQTAPDKLVFRFIPSVRYSPAVGERLLKTLQSLLNNEIACELDKVSEILPNTEGKTPIFIKSFH